LPISNSRIPKLEEFQDMEGRLNLVFTACTSSWNE